MRHGRVEFRSCTAACLHGLAFALAWIPALSLAGFVTLVATAWIDCGEPPSPVRMDPRRFLEFIGGPQASTYDPARMWLACLWAASALGILVTPGLLVLSSAV